MMTMGIHFMFAQHILTNKEDYVQNSRNTANLDADFKRNPTKKYMKQYLKKTMTFHTNATIRPTENARRSLLELIEIQDTYKETTTNRHRQRKRR